LLFIINLRASKGKYKYSHLTYRLTHLATKPALVALMFLEISKEYLSTFNRQIQTQLYNELRQDYSFLRAVCRSLSDLFTSYLDLYFGNQLKEGQIIFHAVSKEIPTGVPVEEMHLKVRKLRIIFIVKTLILYKNNRVSDHAPRLYIAAI
jgi:hypothetical protein